jgi:hypothetical protein
VRGVQRDGELWLLGLGLFGGGLLFPLLFARGRLRGSLPVDRGLRRLIHDGDRDRADYFIFLKSLFLFRALKGHQEGRSHLGIDIYLDLFLIDFQVLQKLYNKFYSIS